MVVGFLILVTALMAWRCQRDRPLVVWSAALALGLLPIPVVLGRFTITQLLEPVFVTAHPGVAILVLLGLTTTRSQHGCVINRRDDRRSDSHADEDESDH